jgi:methylmalonyl-CoA mutase N-terminal domain/subunit
MTHAANDGRVPIQARYPGSETAENPVLRAWSDSRLAEPGPYRPRFMAYSGLGSPEMTAERLAVLQEVGAESFLLAADLPSQLGFDPDHELAHAQVGRAGVSCATLDDFATICSRLDLAAADSVGMLANSLGHIGLGMVHSVLRDRGAGQVKVVMQNDPLKEFTARGTEIHTPEQALRIAADCVAFALDEDIPGVALTVCSNHYDVAGGGPVLAVALALGNAIAYVDELAERGYAPADVATKLMFFLNERSDLFVEASVFRTARLLWSEILRDRYGVEIADQPVATLMGYAHGLESAAEPLVNIPRVTLSVLGSMLGGVDYLCATGYDEALRIPSVDSAALAVRTMQVVAYEHGASGTIDALAGSTKLREIDDYVQTEVRREMRRLFDNGGPLEAIENGYVASRIDENRGAREEQIANRERVMVGHTAFEAPDRADLFSGKSSGEVDFLEVERDAAERITAHKASRDSGPVQNSLDEVRGAAAGKDNILPPTIAALRAGATAEEIVAATREGFER